MAVLREIKKSEPKAEIRFWCDKKFAPQVRETVANFDKNIPVHIITAGKFRRYHHLTVLRQLLWPSLVLKNIRDAFLVVVGFFQSFFKLIVWRPNVVFAKGGYVCLPVGVAAHLLRIPLVIHDSDAHPGLTNRILSKWANAIATGAPLKYYSYPPAKTHYVGIPISSDFHQFSQQEQSDAKRTWKIDTNQPLIVVTGGGLGATRINDTIVKLLPILLNKASVVLISGEGQFKELRVVLPKNDEHFQLYSFVSKGMSTLLGAADLVVARAGATTILELAALAKPTILIPNAKLTGGHQVKNAEVYAKDKAVVLVDEDKIIDDPKLLNQAIDDLLSQPQKSLAMAKRFHKFARPQAAKEMAEIVLSQVK